MTAYYNEIDPKAAQWLRNLIEAGHIAPGMVDERSIEDVLPSDLKGFTQCHFFAGVGVWSHALRQAGWPDDRPVWTGSCPCQPFSAAGKGAGFDDERHLWPDFHHLIKECKPATVIGEQVASKDSDPWIDLIHTDLEALGYAFGAVPFPSAGIGAPHIRDRLYWVADAAQERQQWARASRAGRNGLADNGASIKLGHTSGTGLAQRIGQPGVSGGQARRGEGQAIERTSIHAGGVAHHDSDGRQPGGEGSEAMGHGQAAGADCGAGGVADAIGGVNKPSGAWADQQAMAGVDGAMQAAPGCPGPVNGHWSAADWLFCRDGKWRPVEPGTFPLVNGAPARVVRLRAYGNAINAKAAQAFIECLMEGE